MDWQLISYESSSRNFSLIYFGRGRLPASFAAIANLVERSLPLRNLARRWTNDGSALAMGLNVFALDSTGNRVWMTKCARPLASFCC